MANGTGVKKHTVEVYIRDVEQIFSGMGGEDPRLDVLGNIYLRLSRYLRACSQTDLPLYLVRPIPISLLN